MQVLLYTGKYYLLHGWIAPGLLPWKSAIVTVLSQLTFANDPPSGGEFRDGMR
jgi:hypothetical protein